MQGNRRLSNSHALVLLYIIFIVPCQSLGEIIRCHGERIWAEFNINCSICLNPMNIEEIG